MRKLFAGLCVLPFIVQAAAVHAELNLDALKAKVNQALGTQSVAITYKYLKSAALYLNIQTRSPNHVIHFVSLKLKDPTVDLIFSPCGPRKIPSAWAKQNKASIAVNGNFFPGTPEAPRGIVVSKGKSCPGSRNIPSHPYLGCDRNNFCWIEKSANPLGNAKLFNGAAGQYFVTNGEVTPAMQGKNNRIVPRTLVGLMSKQQNLFFMMIEGRRPSKGVLGMGQEDAAQLLIALGADQALNLDGGGSSTMVLDGELVNARPENEPRERGVANLIGAVWK